nr:putative carbohydrate binding domain containing protein [uncultured Mediterranean phage uvMED]
MATINLGAIKFNWKGAYNSGTSYAVDDVVSSGGNSYVCIQAHSNQAVGNATAYWNIMSSAGTNGTDVGATLANKEIAFKTNAGAVDGIPIGTAGQFLKVNSGATGYEYGAVSSDFVKLAGGNTTSTGTIDIQGCFSTDYKLYKLFCNHNFVSSSYIEVAMLKASDNNIDGATYYSRGNGEYSDAASGNARWTAGVNQNTWAQNDTDGFRPYNTWNSFLASEHGMLEMTFDNPIATRKTMVQSNATWSGGGTDHVGMSHSIGMLDSTLSHSGIRLSSKDNSINFTTTGYYAVYGLKN